MGFCVNEHTMSCHTNFSYNLVESLTKLMQEGDFLTTVNISNAYRAVNIHPYCRECQILTWDFGEGLVNLRDNSLCMGLSPFVFSKISDFVVRCLVRAGHEDCVNYLDDLCVISHSVEGCTAAQWSLLSVLRRLEFYVSFKKLTPPGQGNQVSGDRYRFRINGTEASSR